MGKGKPHTPRMARSTAYHKKEINDKGYQARSTKAREWKQLDERVAQGKDSQKMCGGQEREIASSSRCPR